MHILSTTQLTHSFGPDMVLKGVDLNVEQGSIYGFLGPNGAGKTTTLRLILGLLKIQEGAVTIFDDDLAKDRISVLRRVGSMIESPSVYAHLTAWENLELLQKVYQCPARRVNEVLDLVGLADTGKKRAGQFSLGMKQRLAIAVAMLHEPELLVLDEPTNGLDPNGIIEIRELLRKLNREHGTTILVSSHLLSEIDRLVTHIGIINKGQILFQGTLDELKLQQQRATHVRLYTSDATRTRDLLKAKGIVPALHGERLVLPAMPRERVAGLNRELIVAGIDVYEIASVESDLEKIFIDMVSE